MSREMTQRLILTIRRHQLWSPGDRLLLAVSGGKDSMVMLDMLVATKGLHKGVLTVCTIDHGVRKSSAADVELVREQAAHHELAFTAITLAGEDKDEASLRQQRYQALNRVANGDKLLTAHHADDQLETILINLIRGSGSRGIAGIPRVRGNIVRPLLDFSADDIDKWATKHSVRWHEDPTNHTDHYLRNRIRHHIIPQLKTLQSGITKSISRLSDQLRSDENALQDWLSQTDQWQPDEQRWPTDWLARGVPSLTRRSLLRHVTLIEHRHIDAVLAAVTKESGDVDTGIGGVISVGPVWTTLNDK